MTGANNGRWNPRQTWQRVRAVPGLRRDTLAVVLVAVAGLVATTVIVANQIGELPWASDRVTVRAEFRSAVAVNPSKTQEVRVAGVPVGAIEDSQPTDRGTSILSMSVNRDIAVYRNAQATLRPLNPLNEMYVDLRPGGPPQDRLPANDAIPLAQTKTPTQSDEVFAHLDVRARNALTNLLAESGTALDDAPRHLPGGLRATDGTLVKLRPVVTALQQRRAKIRTLVSSLSQISSAVGDNDKRLKSLIDSTEQTLGVLNEKRGPLADSVRQLPGATADLRSAMGKTSGLTGELNPLLDHLRSASSTLPSSLDSLTRFADEAKKTLPAAAPVIRKARPLVGELRPIVSDAHGSLVDLRPVTKRLDAGTSRVVGSLEGISAFVYNTASLSVARDSNGTMVRGQLELNLLRPFGVTSEGCAPLPNYLPCLPGGLQ